ncbi:MAG: aldo/keto reductase [Chloroflexota bacterium]
MFKTRPIGTTDLHTTEFGLGGTGIANMYQAVSDEDAWGALETAWDGGVRFFDTAPLYGYGLSERRMGDFLRTKKPDEYILSSKVGRLLRPGERNDPNDGFDSPMPFFVEYDYSYDGAMRSFEDSLQRLGLDHIDVVLIHDIDIYTHGEEDQPKMFRAAMDGAIKALEQLRSEGVVGAIGLGVNEWPVCEAALKYADLDGILLAGRYTLLEQTAIETFLPICLERKVSIFLGGVFNSGLLIDPYADNATYNYQTADPEIVQTARQIADICQTHQVPIQAAALQFPLRHPAIASVLSGARSAREVSEITAWMSQDIPAQLWEDLRMAGLMHQAAPTT